MKWPWLVLLLPGCGALSRATYADAKCECDRVAYLTGEPIPIDFTYPHSDTAETAPKTKLVCRGVRCESSVADARVGADGVFGRSDTLSATVTPIEPGLLTIDATLDDTLGKPKTWTYGPLVVTKPDALSIRCESTSASGPRPCEKVFAGESLRVELAVSVSGKRAPTSRVDVTLDGKPLDCKLSVSSPDGQGPILACQIQKLDPGPHVIAARRGELVADLRVEQASP